MLDTLASIIIWCAIYGGFAYCIEGVLIPFCKIVWNLIQKYRGK